MSMSQTCSCGTAIPDGSKFCPSCGKPGGQAPQAPAGGGAAPSTGLTENVAGGLSYFTLIPAVIFLAIEPYNKNSFVRFHAWQSIFLSLAAIVFHVGLSVLAGFMAVVGFFIISPIVSLAFFVLWLICVIQAFQNKRFKLPIIGDLAEKQAGA